VLLDRDHLLLADEAVPAAERLRVVGRILVVGGHVLAHDLGGVAGDIKAGAEAVLQAHAGHRFGLDAIPVRFGADRAGGVGDGLAIGHFTDFLGEALVSATQVRSGG
jgi:hypothetical protein